MANSNRLYRNFVILQEDERGYANSEDKTLSGYSKIEARGDRCKISFYAQNLRKDNDEYCMMVICCKKDMKQIVNLGPIAISESGKGDSTKEYNIANIGGLDLHFDKISGTAIAKMKEGIPVFVLCGFLNGQQPSDNWKNYTIVKAADLKNKYVDKLNDKDSKKEFKKIEKKSDIKEKNKKDECEREDVEAVKEVETVEAVKEVESVKEVEPVTEVEEIRSESVQNENIEVKDNNIEPRDEIVEVENKIIEETVVKAPKENLRGKFEDYEDEIEANKEFDPMNGKIRGSIGEYFEAIVEGFERDYDGIDEIKYTKWYKIPVKDLHEMCNMSNYNKYTLAYYPMLNYYPYIKKYGYFKLGYKCDSKGNLKHIIYGIPGKKDKDEQPYDGRTGFVTWVDDKEGGCWLMFYDFKNSTVVVPMQ